MPVETKSNEIQLTRVYDAPLTAVWDAWADPDQAAQWWGPRGFTITTHSKELSVGGHWKYTMHGPDGVEYANTTKYLEVEKHKKLVYDHGGNDERKPLFRVTVLFSEVDGSTRMDMTMTLDTPEAAEQTRGFIKKAGGDTTWDRLGEYLEKTVHGKDKFVYNRSFDVPAVKMSELWSDANQLAKWMPPTGFKMEFLRADIRPGGTSFYRMSNDAGNAIFGRVEYRDLTKPSRLVYVQQFADQNENITRHPMAPTWPENMLTVVQFTEEAPNRTRVTLTWEPTGNVTSEEVETFKNSRDGMSIGWTGSLDKLEAYIAAL